MTGMTDQRAIAFEGNRRIAMGPVSEVALAVQAALAGDARETVLVFDAESSATIDLDLRGAPDDVRKRYASSTDESATSKPSNDGAAETAPEEKAPPRGPGRPRLGVVGREVTLMPRHWEWLGSQPGGASVTLRRLVEQARTSSARTDGVRRAREAAYRFMSSMAGNQVGFEEATRALFAGNRDKLVEHTASWPVDVREHARQLAAAGEQPAG